MKNPQTKIALTFLTHSISDIYGVYILGRLYTSSVYFLSGIITDTYRIERVVLKEFRISRKFSELLNKQAITFINLLGRLYNSIVYFLSGIITDAYRIERTIKEF